MINHNTHNMDSPPPPPPKFTYKKTHFLPVDSFGKTFGEHTTTTSTTTTSTRTVMMTSNGHTNSSPRQSTS